MDREQRVPITELDGMEGGIRCPNCGAYASFGDVVAVGGCSRGSWRGGPCEATLSLELVVSDVRLSTDSS